MARGEALLLCLLVACGSDDEEAGPNGARHSGPSAGGPGVLPDGGTISPLPPYVVDDSPLPPGYSLFDHAKECFDRFLVEVPAFDCDGPDSSRLKIEVEGEEVTTFDPGDCDKPSLVGNKYACIPGARVTKWEQVNKYGHTIATVAVCRRSSFSSLDSGRFENIAVVQSDLQNQETCWFQIRKDSSFSGRSIPAPYQLGRKKGDPTDQRATNVYVSPVTLTSDGTECYRCHDSRVFLRTPWIGVQNQVPSQTGHTNEIPRTEGEPTFIGRAYRAWNLPSNRPRRIKIDAAKLDQAFPPTPSERAAIQSGTMAASDSCTSCHAMADAKIATAGQGTCNHFARYWTSGKPPSFDGTVLGSRLSSAGNSFPLNAWMPPGAGNTFANDSAFMAFYARAFAAVEICCDDPTRPGCH
jgi:hypothetical protein